MASQVDGTHALRVTVLAALGLLGAVYLALPAAHPVTLGTVLLLVGTITLGNASRDRSALMTLSMILGTGLVALVIGTSLAGLVLAACSIALLASKWQVPRYPVSNCPTSALEELLRAMVSASALRDQQTADHGERVAVNCLAVGVFLGLTQGDLTRLEWSARLHDVGKVAVPQMILRKPGPLTLDERSIVRQHSDLGADILMSTAPSMRDIAVIVRHHHEWWDGSGYPAGLRGVATPLEARIIAVLDMYEALTSDRPYRSALAPSEAHREIVQRAGTQFDPDIVQVFDALWKHRLLVVSEASLEHDRSTAWQPTPMGYLLHTAF